MPLLASSQIGRNPIHGTQVRAALAFSHLLARQVQQGTCGLCDEEGRQAGRQGRSSLIGVELNALKLELQRQRERERNFQSLFWRLTKENEPVRLEEVSGEEGGILSLVVSFGVSISKVKLQEFS